MRYIFKVLILGLDSSTLSYYLINAFNDGGENKQSYIEWYKEVNVFEDSCDLEINAITDMINADFDEIIPTVDGIIYFINPKKDEENEFFEMVLPVIESVKRNIPTIILYYDIEGIITISVNELLENLWMKHIDLEAFVNLPPHRFHQILQCLCFAMISGDTPLNIENAWMRFPIFIQLANIFFKQHQYYYAAQAIRKAALIADIFNKDDYYIISEQAAMLFSKVNLYLEASKILDEVDKYKSYNFKKLYAEHMVLEGNKLFNKQNYDLAARQYLASAQFSVIELQDKELRDEAFQLAINSWISACKVENAFKILDMLPHSNTLSILKNVSDKIVAAADYLVGRKNVYAAKDQLYTSILVYQKEGLFEQLEKFTIKLVEVLIVILDQQLKNKDKFSAKQTYDEIENLWDTFDLDKINLDKKLEKLIMLFLEDFNVGMANIHINKLNSLTLKKKLTKLSSKAEDKDKEIKRQEQEEIIKKGLKILTNFYTAENEIIRNQLIQIFKKADKFVAKKKIAEASDLLKAHAGFLKLIRKDIEKNEVLIKTLSILLSNDLYDDFFENFRDLDVDAKKEYLINVFPEFKSKLSSIKEEREYSELEPIFEETNKIHRDQMLYDQSKEISELFINVIKVEALRIIKDEHDHSGIEKSIELIRKANNINSAYLESTELNFDEIYENIVEIYLVHEDISSAHAHNDKIEDKLIKAKLHKKISDLEAKIRREDIKRAERTFDEEIIRERLTIIKKRSRDAQLDKDILLRQRTGYKRALFLSALTNLKQEDMEKAMSSYMESFNRLIKIKKYDLASVSFALVSLLQIQEEKFEEVLKLLRETKENLANLADFFTETFPVMLIEYILDVKKLDDEERFKESLQFCENMPLFDEELSFLFKLTGKDLEEGLIIEEPQLDRSEIEKIKTRLERFAKTLRKEKQDIAKRKLMKNQYWRFALEDLKNNREYDAALDYWETVPRLVEKKFYNQAALSVIIATILELKTKNINVAKATLRENLYKLRDEKRSIENLTEMKILNEIINIYQNNIRDLKTFAINILLDKLVLFDEEVNMLNIFIEKVIPEDDKRVVMTREQKGQKDMLLVELDQRFGSLQQKMGDVNRERDEFLKKRKAMKRIYYSSILNAVQDKSYKQAGEKYYDLALSTAKRKDLQSSSLLLLLYGTCSLKIRDPLEEIKSKTTEYLDSLGLRKKLVADTYYIQLLVFILDVIAHDVEKYRGEVMELLEIIPIFEEELDLINIRDILNY